MQTETGGNPESKTVEDQKEYLLKGDLTTPVMEAEAHVGAVAVQNLWIIWLAGAAIFLMRKITIYQSLVKYVKDGCQEVSDVNRGVGKNLCAAFTPGGPGIEG